MAQQTINVGAAPNDGTGTPLRTAFQYTNSNFSELYTATGPSGNNITVPGTATITGDLTVDTSTLKVDSANNRVGIGTPIPAVGFDVGYTESVFGSSTSSGYSILNLIGTGTGSARYGSIRKNYDSPFDLRIRASNSNSDAPIIFELSNASTAMTLNATGLGVGTTPANGIKLAAYVTTDGAPATSGTTQTSGSLRIGAASTTGAMDMGTAGSYSWIQVLDRGNLATNYDLVLQKNGGNVGIGVTPEAWTAFNPVLRIKNAGTGGGGALGGTGIDNFRMLTNTYYDGQYKRIGLGYATIYEQGSGAHVWYSNGSGSAGSTFTPTQAMSLDASGNLFVRCTTAGAEQLGFQVIGYTNGNYVRINHNASATSGDSYLNFLYNATPIGSISQNGTTGVLYNINSDYRLKESVQPLVGGLARVNALKPSVYKWKSDGSTGEGFLAHELAEVVPFAVTGEKDAVNEDGSIKSQGIDMSRVVPILVAAIQELTARVQTLETR